MLVSRARFGLSRGQRYSWLVYALTATSERSTLVCSNALKWAKAKVCRCVGVNRAPLLLVRTAGPSMRHSVQERVFQPLFEHDMLVTQVVVHWHARTGSVRIELYLNVARLEPTSMPNASPPDLLVEALSPTHNYTTETERHMPPTTTVVLSVVSFSSGLLARPSSPCHS